MRKIIVKAKKISSTSVRHVRGGVSTKSGVRAGTAMSKGFYG